MSVYEQARKFYRANGQEFYEDLEEYSRRGYAYCSPQCIIFAKYYWEQDCFHIHFAIGKGCLYRFFKLAPFNTKYISFARPGKGRTTKVFDAKRLEHLCKLNSDI